MIITNKFINYFIICTNYIQICITLKNIPVLSHVFRPKTKSDIHTERPRKHCPIELLCIYHIQMTNWEGDQTNGLIYTNDLASMSHNYT